MFTSEEVGMGESLGEKWSFIYGSIQPKPSTIMPFFGVPRRSCKLNTTVITYNILQPSKLKKLLPYMFVDTTIYGWFLLGLFFDGFVLAVN
jgi:hypothetical protein